MKSSTTLIASAVAAIAAIATATSSVIIEHVDSAKLNTRVAPPTASSALFDELAQATSVIQQMRLLA